MFFSIDRRTIRYFDWLSLFLMIALSLIGLAFVYSATFKPEVPYSLFFKKQLFGVISGFIIYGICCFTDFRSLMRWGYFAYFVVIGLLIFTLIKGSIGMGGQRWIDLGIIKVQPSELAKLLFPAYATYYFYTEKETLSFNLREFLPVLTMLIISFIVIRKQPDLGTALIVLFSGLILIWLAGMSKKFFITSLIVILSTAPVLWHCLKTYQKNRVLVFLGYGESKKERYQIEQSQIAIGSGGLWGKGYLKGTQNKLQFLPESRTDFIFSVIAEEMGFAGALCIIVLFLLLIIHLIAIIATIKSPFMQLLASGLIIHIALAAIINIFMVTGLLPVVGIPLPFISYGLSNLWVTFASMGWFNSIALARSYRNE